MDNFQVGLRHTARVVGVLIGGCPVQTLEKAQVPSPIPTSRQSDRRATGFFINPGHCELQIDRNQSLSQASSQVLIAVLMMFCHIEILKSGMPTLRAAVGPHLPFSSEAPSRSAPKYSAGQDLEALPPMPTS